MNNPKNKIRLAMAYKCVDKAVIVLYHLKPSQPVAILYWTLFAVFVGSLICESLHRLPSEEAE